MSQHEGAWSRGGSGGGVPSRYGCGVQARDKICDPALRGELEGGIRGGSFPLCTAAVFKHETCTVTKQTTCARGGESGGVPPPGTAAVSKHETGTVIKQTTGALQFMVAFALQGGGGVATPPRIYLASLCPGRREVCPRTSTPLTYATILSLQGGTVIGALGTPEISKVNQDGARSIHVQQKWEK